MVDAGWEPPAGGTATYSSADGSQTASVTVERPDMSRKVYVATFTVGQEAVSRYYAARDGKAAKQGSVLAAIINFVFAFIPAVLGVIVLALINMGSFSAEQFADVGARYALPVLAMEAMPSVICGLLFAGIISATMSSSDSDLLGAGSIFANDIYHAVLKPNATSDEVMKVTKIVMMLVGVASMFIALFNTSSIVNLLMFCFTLRAAGAFFPYVLGHYWKGSSLAGTIASLISGSIVVVYLEKISGGVLFGMKLTQPIIPGLIVGLVFFLVFSKIFPPKVQTTELAPEED
jgi:SSS family solute:Na+ symporter